MDLIQARRVGGSGIFGFGPIEAVTMTKNGLPAIILTLGLAACSGDDTPTAGTGGGG